MEEVESLEVAEEGLFSPRSAIGSPVIEEGDLKLVAQRVIPIRNGIDLTNEPIIIEALIHQRIHYIGESVFGTKGA